MGVNLQYFDGMNLKRNLKFVQSSLQKKVIVTNECRQNTFKSFANAYKFQMGTKQKNVLSFHSEYRVER